MFAIVQPRLAVETPRPLPPRPASAGTPQPTSSGHRRTPPGIPSESGYSSASSVLCASKDSGTAVGQPQQTPRVRLIGQSFLRWMDNALLVKLRSCIGDWYFPIVFHPVTRISDRNGFWTIHISLCFHTFRWMVASVCSPQSTLQALCWFGLVVIPYFHTSIYNNACSFSEAS